MEKKSQKQKTKTSNTVIVDNENDENTKPPLIFNVPEENDNDPEKGKFVRKEGHHKTVSINLTNKKGLQLPTKPDVPSKFQRKNVRAKSLIEKVKSGNSIFKEELKLKVTINTLIEETNGLPTMKYKVISRLGDGSYGSVYLAINLMTKANVAMKKINKIKENEVDDMEIKNEIDILKKLDHPNTAKILEFYSTPKAYYIVTDYCSCGELYNQIKHEYNENQLAVLFYQVFSALTYLHTNNIVHRDLKLENILISEIEKDKKTGKKYFWIKIIDFGTAKIFEKNRAEKTVIGSSYYIAPEVLKKKYNEKCDTWSVGVILYMTLVGSAPFDGKTDNDIIKRIKLGKYNKNTQRFAEHSEEVKDLVNGLLEKNIEKRLSAKEALNHPWFDKYGGRRLFSNFKPEDIKPYIENLFKYKYHSKLQELVIAFLVHNLSNNDETLIILKMFRYFNKSGDCKLTKNELTNGLYSYKDKKDVDEMADIIFERLDGDNNGYIEYEEFLRACIDKKALMTKENLKYAFKFLDKDNSKTLNAKKIIKAFLTKPNKEFEAIFNITLNEVDKDSDGIINFEEFMELMLKIQ
jgi:calcium-dependent protein kinase